MRADLLHAVSCYFNARRNPYLLLNAKTWLERTQDSGVHVTFVEHQIGDRPFEFTHEKYPHVNLIQLRGTDAHELWLKEALTKAGMARLPQDAKYVCWEDADVEHALPAWAAETVQMLQNHRVGQTWSHAIDFGPQGEVMRNEWGNDADRSFSAAFLAGDLPTPVGNVLIPEAVCKASPVEGYGSGSCGGKAEYKRDFRQHFGYSWAARREVLQGIGGLMD